MINKLTETERWTDDKQIHCSAAGKTKMKDDDVEKKIYRNRTHCLFGLVLFKTKH